MSVANRVLRNPVANGGFGDFGDPDFTPKPLRISKREKAGPSTASQFNSSLSTRKSQTHHDLQALAPSKRSFNSTQLNLSRQDLAVPISEWARRNTFLHVHKQRRSEPIYTNTPALMASIGEPIGLSPFTPATSRNSCPTMSQLGSSSDASQAITVARPSSTRAFTVGTYRKPDSLSPIHEVSLSPSASSALREGPRRAVTNVEPCYSDLDALKSLAHRGLRKQRSFKNNLMSRMMSGLTNRTHAGHAAPRDGNHGTKTLDSPPATPSRVRNHSYPLKQSNASEMHPLRQSNSSDRQPLRQGTLGTRTETYYENDLHHALATFPTPPASDPTSSMSAGSLTSRNSIRPGRSHNSISPERSRDLCTPADAALMGAELKLTPEYDQLSSEKGRGMLVSLDIKGITNSTSGEQDVWSEHTGLDIVVVIDNSLHTSPAALMASCETARFLASILNKITDRLAIMCTSTTGTSPTNSTVVLELSQINTPSIKTALDAITSSIERPRTNAWIDTIHYAEEILLKSAVTDSDEEPLQDTFGHIFLFTPNPDGLPFPSMMHEKLTFHIISPAGAPRNDHSIQCNGWRLRSLSGNDAQVVSKKRDVDPMSVSNRLRILIPQARSGKVLGTLTELVLEVSAGPDCTIEDVIGKVEFNKLHPGEVFTTLFKLRLCATTVEGYSFSRPATPRSEALADTNDVMSHLDKMFGTTDTKILFARLTYRHSLLPAGTTCSITTECHMKRVPPDPDQMPGPSKYSLHQVRDCTVLVEKRLAYHLATQGSPRNALKNLQKEYGDSFQFSACPDYIRLLAKELKYQARIVERLEIDASPKKPSVVHTADSPPEIYGQSSVGVENYKPRRYLSSDIPTEELFKAKPALTVLSVKNSREQLRTDEARKIWGDMRKMTRPPNQTMKGRSQSSQLDEARREGIRELAVKNKRSVGSETLRSIFSVGESMGKGLGAPWM